MPDPSIVTQLKISFGDRMLKLYSSCSCPKCSSVNISKHGKSSGNRQRYLCHSCKKTFIIRDNYADDDTRKKKDTWNLFIDCMLLSMSCRHAASVCGISKNTAFKWRHQLFDTVDIIYSDAPLPSDNATGGDIERTEYDPSIIMDIFTESDSEAPANAVRVDVDEWKGVYLQNVPKYRKWQMFVRDAYASGYEHQYIARRMLGKK